MSQLQTLAQAEGLLKPRFGKIQKLLSETSVIQKLAPFETANRVGDYFTEPLVVRNSWGVTYLGTDGAGIGGSGDLVEAISSKTVALKVTPSMMILRDQPLLALIDRSSGGISTSFMADATLVAETLASQMRNLIEIGCIAGQQGFATVDTYNGGTDVCTVTTDSLRPGFLANLEGATVDFFQSNLTTLRVDSTAGADLLDVSAVDVDAGTFALGDVPSTDPQPGDVVFIHGSNGGSGAFQDMVGLKKQITAQTGVVFNVDKALYSAYRGNVSHSFGPMSAGSLLALASKAVNKGMLGKMIALLSPKAWMVLNSKYLSQQVFDSSYSVTKGEEGTNKIFISGQGVTIEAIPHPYQAQGEVMLLPADYLKRIGSEYENSTEGDARDITFQVYGMDAGTYLKSVPDKAATEMQVRTDQQIIDTRPAWSCWADGVTYTA